MKKLLSKIKFEIKPRLRLLRIALTNSYIWSDILAMAQKNGIQYRDVVADVEPLEFARQVFGNNHSSENLPPAFSEQLGSAKDFTPAGAPEYYNSEPSVGRFLGHLVYYRKPLTVVELGCFVGWTSAHLALALNASGQTGSLYCVDGNQDYLNLALRNLKRHDLDQKAILVKGFSLDEAVLSKLPKEIDILFIDTAHHYPETLNEIRTYAPRMAAGGCMVLHDSVSWSGVRRSLSELEGQFRVLTFATEEGNGVTVLLNTKLPI